MSTTEEAFSLGRDTFSSPPQDTESTFVPPGSETNPSIVQERGKIAAKTQAKGKAKGEGKTSGKTKRIPMARSHRAGLQFPVGRIHRRMKQSLLRHQRCGSSAAIYTAALLEYLTAEVLELAGNACIDLKAKRITPRHILLAVRGDEELDSVVRATISGGGVVPQLHRMLLKKNKSSKKKKSG